MAPEGTLPAGPGPTADTPTEADPGRKPCWNWARGTVTSWVVAKVIPLPVETFEPDGIETLFPVSLLLNRTVPVAAVLLTFLPVALKVPEALKSMVRIVAGTTPPTGSVDVAFGSARIESASGPTASSLGVITIVALGSRKTAIRPRTSPINTTVAAEAPIKAERCEVRPGPRTVGAAAPLERAPIRPSGTAGGPPGDPRPGDPGARGVAPAPAMAPAPAPAMAPASATLAAAALVDAPVDAPLDLGPTAGGTLVAAAGSWTTPWSASNSATVAKTGRPAEAASARAAASVEMIDRARLRSSASRASSRKLIREVAMREPGGTTRPTRGSSDPRIRAAADVISSSTSR